jgi:hypothetical protein
MKAMRKGSMFAALAIGWLAGAGCDNSTVTLERADPVSIPAAKPVPATPQEGGGAGSSGNMNRNPGGNT